MKSKEAFKFKKYTVNGVDMRPFIVNFQYKESIFLPYVQLTTPIVETLGLIDEIAPNTTPKEVKFSIESRDGDKIKVENLKLATLSQDSKQYLTNAFIISSVSEEAYNNTLLSNRCRRAHGDKISDVWEDIMKKDLKTKVPLKIDETKNFFHGLGEDRYPFEFALDLQRIAIPERGNAGYVFWQDSRRMNFRSLDVLYKKDPIRKFIETKKATLDTPAGFDDKILSSSFGRTTDILFQYENGAYGSQVEVFDEIEKKYQIIPSDNEEQATVRFPIAKAKGQTVVPNDSLEEQVEKQELVNYNVEEIVRQSRENFRNKFNMYAEIKIPADLELHPGDRVYCQFPSLKDSKGKEEKTSGIYMIVDLCHYGDRSRAFTGLFLVKEK